MKTLLLSLCLALTACSSSYNLKDGKWIVRSKTRWQDTAVTYSIQAYDDSSKVYKVLFITWPTDEFQLGDELTIQKKK